MLGTGGSWFIGEYLGQVDHEYDVRFLSQVDHGYVWEYLGQAEHGYVGDYLGQAEHGYVGAYLGQTDFLLLEDPEAVRGLNTVAVVPGHRL
jgi:hypothetical protein